MWGEIEGGLAKNWLNRVADWQAETQRGIGRQQGKHKFKIGSAEQFRKEKHRPKLAKVKQCYHVARLKMVMLLLRDNKARKGWLNKPQKQKTQKKKNPWKIHIDRYGR